MAAGVLGAAALYGFHPNLRWLMLILLSLGAVVLALRPVLGLLALVLAALVGRAKFGTGTAVAINPATLLVPTLFVIWVLYMILRRDVRLVPSRTNAPLGLFLLSGLVSLLLGTALWDPGVPHSNNLIVVQIAQWAVFAFSAAAFWLTGNLITDEVWLDGSPFSTSESLVHWQSSASCPSRGGGCKAWRPPPWSGLPSGCFSTALAGGQLIFNRALSTGWRVFLVASLAAAGLCAVLGAGHTL